MLPSITCGVSSSSNDQSSSIPPSPSASVPKGTYDVFLSFRGEDTRKGFISHLYRALIDKGIHTFLDAKRLDQGKDIEPELVKAIVDSKIAIVVFSKNYAGSSWCLDELVKIVEGNPEKIVIPVFYDVDPSDLRHQRNRVVKALAKLRRSIDDSRMQRWKEALTKATSFSGWDVRNTANGDESECIRQIVIKVHGELSCRLPSSSEDLVGMEQRVNKVVEMLRVGECYKIIVVGIRGMGGAGKTTTARATLDKLSPSFKDGSCFLQIPIGERSENGLKNLQKTLLSEILKLKVDEINIRDTKMGINMIKERFRSKKILIVLDNVDNRQQLNALAPDKELFGPGSRVVITTRDNQLLDNADESYEVELLNPIEAMQLFTWHAFQKTTPPEDFAEMSHEVVKHAKGLPLALQVLGSHLRGLSPEEWSSEINVLKKIPHDEILRVLKISYDGLDETNKNIFLDVACFFRGRKVNEVKQIHERGVSLLQRKSLVSVDKNGYIDMHDLVQQMGWKVARKDHPGIRLWDQKEVLDVLSGKRECDAVESIYLNVHEKDEDEEAEEGKGEKATVDISYHALKRMKRTRLLSLHNLIDRGVHNFRNLDGSPPECLSNELQWLEWYGYPWHSLPPSFQGTKLAMLKMRASNIIEPIAGGQNFAKLKLLDLSNSNGMTQTPDFSQFPSLEELYMKNCDNLVEIHSSFGDHQKLVSANMSSCKNLEKLPKRLRMGSLKNLSLFDCRNLENFPDVERNMIALEELNLLLTAIKTIPDSFRNLRGLRKLWMYYTKRVKQTEIKRHGDPAIMDSAIPIVRAVIDTDDDRTFRRTHITLPLCFPKLKFLKLSGCDISSLWIPKSCLPSLQQLHLQQNRMKELVISEDCLYALSLLDLTNNREYSDDRKVWKDLPNFNEDGGISILSLIHTTKIPGKAPVVPLDWESLSRVLCRRDSMLTINMDRTEIPNWFRYQICGLNCEVILPPLTFWSNQSLRGVAIFLRTSGYLSGKVNFWPRMVLFQEETYSMSPHNILCHYMPFSSQWLEQWASCSKATYQSQKQSCLFEACFTWSDLFPTDTLEWGLRLIYEDEAFEINYNGIIGGLSDEKHHGGLKVIFSNDGALE